MVEEIEQSFEDSHIELKKIKIKRKRSKSPTKMKYKKRLVAIMPAHSKSQHRVCLMRSDDSIFEAIRGERTGFTTNVSPTRKGRERELVEARILDGNRQSVEIGKPGFKKHKKIRTTKNSNSRISSDAYRS